MMLYSDTVARLRAVKSEERANEHGQAKTSSLGGCVSGCGGEFCSGHSRESNYTDPNGIEQVNYVV